MAIHSTLTLTEIAIPTKDNCRGAGKILSRPNQLITSEHILQVLQMTDCIQPMAAMLYAA